MATSNLLIHDRLSTNELNNVITLRESADERPARVDQLLIYSEIKSDHLWAAHRPLLLSQLPARIEQPYQLICEESCISFHAEYASDLPAEIVSDCRLLSVILHQLLNNAVQYTPQYLWHI